MAFPAQQPILDPFDGPVGALAAPNWRGPANGDASNLTIVAGGGAQAAVDNVFSASVWATPAAMAISAFVTLAGLQSVGKYVTIGAVTDLAAAGNVCYAYFLNVVTPELHVTSNTGGDSSVTFSTPGAGDSLGWSYDPSIDTAYVWYRRAGSAVWVQKASLVAGLKNRTSGWLLYMETNDGGNLRLRNFGGQLLASGVGSPVLGHGSC